MNTDLVYSFRITKYATLGSNGARTSPPSEWTGFSDVGRKVTLADYLQVEAAYLRILETACIASGTTALQVRALEGEGTRDVTDGQWLGLTEALEMARQVLREACWCMLAAERMEVHFGYDYYLYVAAADDILTALERTEPGLFVERYPSPYLQPMDEADVAL